jgi:tetratricopeptide (TPR) repeat protein
MRRNGEHHMADASEQIKRIKTIEESIENALWTCVADEDHEKALGEYEHSKQSLEALQDLSDDAERERKRVLSYCLLRINDALERLERSEGSMRRAEQSLKLAEESNDRLQILRSKLALGVVLLNSGKLREAERHFTDIILQTQDETEDKDVIQVYGWALIVRVNILLGKNLYSQAKELADQALRVLSGIENYAGLRTAHSLLARIYEIEGDTANTKFHRQSFQKYEKLAQEHRQ